ncbi:MAG: aspartate aminotransferase family protein [Acidimicrobiaceae bacterium]|jgi:4-aminobutyrate aminotransferase|nr:aspartate aminotransferase family protein [Acidimicrobiaceae bacterium]|tara:strand:+ start:3799 stop:5103 length:1305 start_codon:yes stop_codon:yes gene_type:complete
MSTNTSLHHRYKAIMAPYLNPLYTSPISIDRGEGSFVWDVEGNQYLDFFGGVLTTMIGHNNPAVTEAIQSQASKVLHTSTLYLSEPMIELAEEIGAASGIPDARVFFTTSGSEANDTALMLATSYRNSNEILAMRHSYHGRTFATQAITSQSTWLSSRISGLSVNYVQGPYRLRSPFQNMQDEEFTNACVTDLQQILDTATTGNVACLIFEPIQGVGGFAIPPDGFYGEMSKVLSNYGALLISDEVQTGWGRTGDHFWGYQAHGIIPDMLTFAKGVGNGITLAGVVARAEIMENVTALNFSTFGGNPLSAAAGLATFREVKDQNMQRNASEMGKRLKDGLHAIVNDTSWIGDLRGRGLMVALEIVGTEPGEEIAEPFPERAAEFLEACKDQGLLLGKGGAYGNVIRITPMLNATASEIDQGIEAISAAIKSIDQ